MLSLIVHSLILLASLCGVGFACAWLMRRSRVMGAIVLAGVVVRVVSGAGLFAVTQTSLFAGAHSGDGFWNVVPDAGVYFGLAARAAREGLFSVPSHSPSPFYLNVLGFWMRVSGVFVLNAVFFNVLCYVIACMVIAGSGGRWSSSEAHSWKDDIPILVPILGLTASPLQLLTATQVLKDSFFTLLVVVACIGVLRILDLLAGRSPSGREAVVWTAVVALAQFGIAGTRAYFSVMFWLALCAGFLFLPWLGLRARRGRTLAATVGILSICWAAFMAGSGAYYPFYGHLIARVTGFQIPLITTWSGSSAEATDGETAGAAGSFLTFRRGFIRSGGGTLLSHDEGNGTLSSMALDTAFGLAATFVPITVLTSLGIVEIEGGRGLLVVTDLDTLFIDLMFVVAMGLVYRHRSLLGPRLPGVLFVLVLATVSAVLLAYVVTNFGTLFRLRALAVVPLWLIPLALAAETKKPDRRSCAA